MVTATVRQHGGSRSPACPDWHHCRCVGGCLSVRPGLSERALQIKSSFCTYSFCPCMQPAWQRPGGLAGRCLSPTPQPVQVLHLVFTWSCSAEGGHGRRGGGKPARPSSPGRPSWVGHLHPVDLLRAWGCRLPPAQVPGSHRGICLLLDTESGGGYKNRSGAR